MNEQNDKQANKRISSFLSAIDSGAMPPDKQSLNKLQEQSTAEFLASSAHKNAKSEKATISLWQIVSKSPIIKLAAAAVIIVGVLFVINYFGSSTDKIDGIDKKEAKRPSSLGDLSLAQRVARSSAIVRATLEEVTDSSSCWRVKKVLYGDVDKEIIDVLGFPVSVSDNRVEFIEKWVQGLEMSKGRVLTAEEIWEEFRRIHSDWPTLGKEVILELGKTGSRYNYGGAAYDVPPNFRLDDHEKKIRQVLDSGAHKTAHPENGRL